MPLKRPLGGICVVVFLAAAGCGRLRSAALGDAGVSAFATAVPAAGSASAAALSSDMTDDDSVAPTANSASANDAFHKGYLLHQEGCATADTYACNSLGVDYETARGTTQNYSRAVEYFKKACDLGAGFGCANLGRMTEDGTGVSADPVRAAALYEQACDEKSPAGCSFLGVAYSNGFGVSKDGAKAVLYLKQGCEHPTEPDGYGCDKLGDLYAKGLGAVPADAKKAAIYYKKACDNDYAAGCTSLGNTLRGSP